MAHPDYIQTPEQVAKLDDWIARIDAALVHNTCHAPRLKRLRGYIVRHQRTNARDMTWFFIQDFGAGIESELRGADLAIANRMVAA